MAYGNATRFNTAGAGSVPALPPEIDFAAWNKDEYFAARMLGISVQGVRRMRASGTGPAWRKIGALCRYSAKSVMDWADAQPGGGAQ